MIRSRVFQELKGFSPMVIAGEEPELCYRLRQKGWKIHRLDHQMTLHDAAITHFSQWWKRAVRSGHAYAHGYALHGREKERYCLRDLLRIWIWIVVIPIFIVLSVLIFNSAFFFFFVVYFLYIVKITMDINCKLNNMKYSFLYATFNLFGKIPQLIGQILFIIKFIFKRKFSIIEYN